MIDGAIILVAGASYLLGWLDLCFWILISAIASGAVATIRSIVDPEWYWAKRMETLGLANTLNAMESGRRSFAVGLLPTKAALFTILGLAAWHVGGLAGYF
jgi:hypothetical protein